MATKANILPEAAERRCCVRHAEERLDRRVTLDNDAPEWSVFGPNNSRAVLVHGQWSMNLGMVENGSHRQEQQNRNSREYHVTRHVTRDKHDVTRAGGTGAHGPPSSFLAWLRTFFRGFRFRCFRSAMRRLLRWLCHFSYRYWFSSLLFLGKYHQSVASPNYKLQRINNKIIDTIIINLMECTCY